MSDCRFGVSPVNYPDPDPDPGLDAMSLDWPTVVQLVVSFNSGLQWGLAKSTLS